MASSTTVLPSKRTPANPSCFNEVSENEVLKIIKNSPAKSCLLDPVPTFLLKDCVEILLQSVTKLVNLSLAVGVFPQKFKKVVVTPHIKKASFPSQDLQKNVILFYVKIGGSGSCQPAHATSQQ